MLCSCLRLQISLTFSANLIFSSFKDFSNCTSSFNTLSLRFSFTSLMFANAMLHFSEQKFLRT
ncbi:hypothetical protein HanIR_Chr14g0692371 [Helianthus annuus]|nr:hypothetical protein HanIR_Chr14g0692371 [Helianthus annuus]